ncbi:unnamed protein product [Moneuplotes crassus]|uniref:Uncharacterized protein n=1 Tax=Euplotes crassus TaxID=5936 RepID=A0AAD1XX54_EUPCR|nr:unnamed protein product [Moneuplotes crassus]
MGCQNSAHGKEPIEKNIISGQQSSYHKEDGVINHGQKWNSQQKGNAVPQIVNHLDKGTTDFVPYNPEENINVNNDKDYNDQPWKKQNEEMKYEIANMFQNKMEVPTSQVPNPSNPSKQEPVDEYLNQPYDYEGSIG